jgi:hypothetical protein
MVRACLTAFWLGYLYMGGLITPFYLIYYNFSSLCPSIRSGRYLAIRFPRFSLFKLLYVTDSPTCGLGAAALAQAWHRLGAPTDSLFISCGPAQPFLLFKLIILV